VVHIQQVELAVELLEAQLIMVFQQRLTLVVEVAE
jgi:hypothetical protein